MPVARDLRAAVREPGFLRLYATRLAGQSADGVFQIGLAGFVLFSPERQASATDIAAALAILLIPFSLVGPFAGVFIDRWHRQRILFVTNLLRALAVVGVGVLVAAGVTGAAFYLSALVVISMNRFVLATLSAGLPHVVRPRLLIAANAVSTTSGTIAALVGGAIGYLVHHFAGASDAGSAAVLEAAAVLYLLATLAASTMRVDLLGPQDAPTHRLRLRHAMRDVAVGFVDALSHLRERPAATRALTAMTAQRVAYGFAVVTTILLCRNYLSSPHNPDDGLRTLAVVVVATGIGVLAGAVITPTITRRLGVRRWVAACFVASAAIQVACGVPYTLPALAIGGALLGVFAQSVRICIDTIVQRSVADDFRGRVFSLYDMLFNVAFVLSATVAAFVLPADGRSPVTLILVAIGYLATAVWWLRSSAAETSAVSPLDPAAAPTSDAAPPLPRPQ